MRQGALRLDGGMDAGDAFLEAGGAPAETPVLTAVRPDGSCVFHERRSGLCAIHRHAGAALLPIACRQFPRVSLLDGRGLFVNVSHYCPTAARQLFRSDVPLEIVEAPPAFPEDFPFDPLDARGALPPLLKPGVLADLKTFGRWERTAVGLLAREGESAERALEEISAFTEELRRWTPGNGPLGAHFDDVDTSGLPARAQRPADVPPTSLSRRSDGRGDRHYNLVLGAIPADLRPTVSLDGVAEAYQRWVEGGWGDFADVVRRYLAAKLFGSWLAYQGGGLRTIVHSLAVALSVLAANAALECRNTNRALDDERLIAAIRRTDEMLVHLSSRQDLANALSAIEF